MDSIGERTFATMLRFASAPDFVREFAFHPERKWRFDFAWPERKVAVEIEGGVFTNGRHTRGKQFTADCEKYNTAAAMGWIVLRFTTDMVTKKPAACVEQLLVALRQREVKRRTK